MDAPFGPLAPDQGDFTPGIMMVADGVQCLAEGYGPQAALVTASSATALAAAPRGLFPYQTADGAWNIVGATSTALYKIGSDYSWGAAIDSGLASTAGDDFCFAQFGTKLLYSNTTQGMRAYDVEAGGAAVAVANAKAPRQFFECGNILFLLDCLDSASARNTRLIRSSAFSDHTNYSTKGADYQVLETGGGLIWGGKVSDTTALVLQQRQVRLIQIGQVGSALWGIQSISDEFGAVGAKSCVAFDGAAYWLATDGFRKFSLSGGVERIGAGLIDQWFLGQADSDLSLVQAAIDPQHKCVLWRWKKSTDISTTVFENIIGYNWQFKRWFTLTLQTSYLGFSAQAAVTWDAYVGVWDDADLPWDSTILKGGQPVFGALGPTYKFSQFGGSPLAATLQTGVLGMPGSSLITRATPMDDSVDGTLELGVRTALNDATAWKTGVAKTSTGRTGLRGRGKYLAFRRNITASSTWSYAKGVDRIVGSGDGPK